MLAVGGLAERVDHIRVFAWVGPNQLPKSDPVSFSGRGTMAPILQSTSLDDALYELWQLHIHGDQDLGLIRLCEPPRDQGSCPECANGTSTNN